MLLKGSRENVYDPTLRDSPSSIIGLHIHDKNNLLFFLIATFLYVIAMKTKQES